MRNQYKVLSEKYETLQEEPEPQVSEETAKNIANQLFNAPTFEEFIDIIYNICISLERRNKAYQTGSLNKIARALDRIDIVITGDQRPGQERTYSHLSSLFYNVAYYFRTFVYDAKRRGIEGGNSREVFYKSQKDRAAGGFYTDRHKWEEWQELKKAIEAQRQHTGTHGVDLSNL